MSLRRSQPAPMRFDKEANQTQGYCVTLSRDKERVPGPITRPQRAESAVTIRVRLRFKLRIAIGEV
jgi:hypothetical protein